MLASGVPPANIDDAMLAFGMPFGPLDFLDEIGLDTALQGGMVLSEVTGERSGGTEILLRLVKARQVGVKSGVGIYVYPRGTINPSLEAFSDFRESRDTERYMLHHAGKPIESTLLTPMIKEADRLLAENKVDADWKLDLATIFGLGFPCWRGGLLWWGRSEIKTRSVSEG